jgi:hypothetical protein
MFLPGYMKIYNGGDIMKKSLGKLFTSALLAICLISVFAFTALAATEWLSSDKWEEAVFDLGTDNTGKVVIEFDGTPLMEGLDLVVGFVDSSNDPTGWDQLNILVRFGDGFQNFIDARNGAAYGFVNQIDIVADQTYHVKIITDPSAGTYDAWVDGIVIADDYAYRLLAPAIDDIGKLVLIAGVEEQAQQFKVTDFTVTPYEEPVSPTTFDGGFVGYIIAGAGSGLAVVLLGRKKK